MASWGVDFDPDPPNNQLMALVGVDEIVSSMHEDGAESGLVSMPVLVDDVDLESTRNNRQ